MASSAYDETYNAKKLKSIGLTNFGKDSIKLCEENGVIIDVSHIGEKSFWDIINCSSKPIIASHSCVYNLCPHYRNLRDENFTINLLTILLLNFSTICFLESK